MEQEKIFNPDLGNNLLNKIDDWVYKVYNTTFKSWNYYDKDGLEHRLHAPAIEYDDGGYEYRFHGKNHRLDGIQFCNLKDGYYSYCIMDEEYLKDDYWKHPDVIAYCKENNITNEFLNNKENNSVKNELIELRDKLNHIIENL